MVAMELPLKGGLTALVDEDTFAWASRRKWCISSEGYVEARINYRIAYLHRLITNAPADLYVDHIDHDPLNNQRSNLRVVTNSQNMQNRRGAQRNSRTGVRGVHWHAASRLYCAALRVNRRHFLVGYFHRLDDAEVAVKAARAALMTHAQECDLAGANGEPWERETKQEREMR